MRSGVGGESGAAFQDRNIEQRPSRNAIESPVTYVGTKPPRKEEPMPAKTEKQRKFMGAELARKRDGKKTKTGMSEKKLEEFASKGKTKGPKGRD